MGHNKSTYKHHLLENWNWTKQYHLFVSVNIYILFFFWSSIEDIIKMFRIVSEIIGESSSCKDTTLDLTRILALPLRQTKYLITLLKLQRMIFISFCDKTTCLWLLNMRYGFYNFLPFKIKGAISLIQGFLSCLHPLVNCSSYKVFCKCFKAQNQTLSNKRYFGRLLYVRHFAMCLTYGSSA